MPYPSVAAIQAWNASVQPVGALDDSLFGYAFAAWAGHLPASMDEFQTFYKRVFVVVSSTGWTSEFVLGYIQAVGDFPQSADAFGSWLTANGYGDGHGGKTGKYPRGGEGYPPGGSAGPGTPTSLAGIEAWVKANPIEAAIGGVVALLVLKGRL